MTTVDAWIQHPTQGFLDNPIFESLLRWMGVEEPPESLPLELTVGALEAAGVDRGLMSAWHGPEGAMISNDEVAESVRQHPERLSGIGAVDLDRPMAAVEEVGRCVEELGFVGIRVLPWLWERPPDHRSYYPVYVACVCHDVPFCVQVGHTGPLKPSEPGRPIPYLERVALDFPELTIVAGHLGHPWTEEMIALARKYPNVYIDTSAWKPSRYPSAFVDYLSSSGARKVLFGSNYPMIMPADCLREVDALGLDEAARARFLGGNARRIFGLGDGQDNEEQGSGQDGEGRQ